MGNWPVCSPSIAWQVAAKVASCSWRILIGRVYNPSVPTSLRHILAFSLRSGARRACSSSGGLACRGTERGRAQPREAEGPAFSRREFFLIRTAKACPERSRRVRERWFSPAGHPAYSRARQSPYQQHRERLVSSRKNGPANPTDRIPHQPRKLGICDPHCRACTTCP